MQIQDSPNAFLSSAAQCIVPVVAELAKFLLVNDKTLHGQIIGTLIDQGSDQAGDKLAARLKAKPDRLIEAHQHLFLRYTGWVIGELIKQAAQQPVFEKDRTALEVFAADCPERWKAFVLKGTAHLDQEQQQEFLSHLADALATGQAVPQFDDIPFKAFFSWNVPLKGDLPDRLDAHLKRNLDNALQSLLVDGDASASQAWKQIVHSGIIGIREELAEQGKKIASLDYRTAFISDQQAEHRQEGRENHAEVMAALRQLLPPPADPKAEQAKIEALIAKGSPASRLEAYRRSLRFAFSRYEELALDHIAAADSESPSILDVFVHPACHTAHLRPEDIDADERHRQGLPNGKALAQPIQDLIPLLAQDDHRRTVLLADPGMGKSTLIQSLIAHLASGQPIDGAPELQGYLPVPFILRDLVHHLKQDYVEKWNWQSLVTAFISSYARVPDAPPLCVGYQSEPDEFVAIISQNPKVFFLIDGLDEIGDLRKRKQIVQAIQEGIRSVLPEARWLITSRVIGYEDARVDVDQKYADVEVPGYSDGSEIRTMISEVHAELQFDLKLRWGRVLEGESHQTVGDDQSEADEDETYPMEGDVFGEGSYQEHFSNSLDFTETPEEITVMASISIAQRLYLAPFDDNRQAAFSQRWFQHRSTHDYSGELLSEVRKSYQDGVRIISRVPNLLCMMNMLKRSGKQLPDGRHALYAEITRYYLGGLEQAYRQKKILGLMCPFAAPERQHLLALLGAHMQHQRTAGAHSTEDGKPTQTNDTILISRSAIHTLLVPVIQSFKDQRKVTSEDSAADLLDELLGHIASRSGLLIPRSVDVQGQTEFAFTHLSFLEFFCASHLCQQLDYQEKMDSAELKAVKAKRPFDAQAYERQYPRGPYPFQPSDFAALAAQPLWHEVLILLMEAHSATNATQQRDALLESLFPPLYAEEAALEPSTRVAESLRDSSPSPGAQTNASRSDAATPLRPLLPLPAVELAVKLAHDRDLALSESTRQHWWRILWAAHLEWPYKPWDRTESNRWHVAPLLLDRLESQEEVLRCLAEVQPHHLGKPVHLNGCATLTGDALKVLSSSQTITDLDLEHCRSITILPDLRGMTGLRRLSLQFCLGLEGSDTLDKIGRLVCLEALFLAGCPWLKDTIALAGLTNLQTLSINNCEALKGRQALDGLRNLSGLTTLWLANCTGLEDTAALQGLTQLRKLGMQRCTGLQDARVLEPLAGLEQLQLLSLYGCTGLTDLHGLGHLRSLEWLDFSHCTGLQGAAVLEPLAGLEKLHTLYLDGCTGITRAQVENFRQQVMARRGAKGQELKIYEP